jgi:hypothetical protein
LIVLVARLETLAGKIPGTSYGDTLVFGIKGQELNPVLFFGEFALNPILEALPTE